VHDKRTTDFPKKPEPPARHKDEIKKCDTKGCDLSEEDLIEKLGKKKKSSESQKNSTKASSFLFFNSENQDKLFDYINSPSINSLAFRGHHQHGE